MGYLIHIGNKESYVDKGHQESNYNFEVILSEAEYRGHHESREGHCTGYRKAVCRCKAIRLHKFKHDKKHGNQEKPVYKTYIYL